MTHGWRRFRANGPVTDTRTQVQCGKCAIVGRNSPGAHAHASPVLARPFEPD